MYNYDNDKHERWVAEVKELYEKVKKHKEPYDLDFLGNKITILPDVFSPKYFNNTKWYAEKLAKIIGSSSILEIGTGTGAIAIHCFKEGADVYTTDISEKAVECAKENFKKLGLNIPIVKSNVYDTIGNNKKYDYIFWNHPYNNSKEETSDVLMMAGFDFNYSALRKYIGEAHNFLKNSDMGLLLGTGGQADISLITQIANENCYFLRIIDSCEMPLGIETVEKNDFRIYELIKKKIMNKEDLWKLHAVSSDWVKVADSKAILIAAVIGVVVTLFGTMTSDSLSSLVKTTFSLTFFLASVVFALISILAAILSLYSTIKHNLARSNIYFADISKLDNNTAYYKEINQSHNIEEDLASQIYLISKIAYKKHLILQWSIAFLGISILSLAISLIIGIFL